MCGVITPGTPLQRVDVNEKGTIYFCKGWGGSTPFIQLLYLANLLGDSHFCSSIWPNRPEIPYLLFCEIFLQKKCESNGIVAAKK